MDPGSEPTPRTVRILREELYANACAIPSTLGGGAHGHLGMIMPNAQYITLSAGGAAYVDPVPPVEPVYGGAAAVIALQNNRFNTQEKIYLEYRDLSGQFKAQLIQAVPMAYIRALKHPQLGFANATPMIIMDHLLLHYGEIKSDDLMENMDILQAPWNPDTPIEEAFTKAFFCRDFALEGEDPISDTFLTRYIVKMFDKSGVLEKGVDDWNKLARVDQTLATCETHFTAANHFRLTKLAKDSKDILAANTAVTNETVDKPKDLEALIAEGIAKANKEAHKTVPTGYQYCWSCGICKHTSRQCKHPKDGHKLEATMYDRMEGSVAFPVPWDRTRSTGGRGGGRGRGRGRGRDRENTNPNANA